MFDKGDFQSFKNMIKSDYSFESVEKSLYNIFEPNVFALKNEVFTAKKSIENILSKNVHMSGSGSSMFTLYKNSVDQDIDYNILCENNILVLCVNFLIVRIITADCCEDREERGDTPPFLFISPLSWQYLYEICPHILREGNG
jgi:hypothetical protein